MTESELYQPILDYLAYRRIPAKRNQCGVLHIGGRWVNLGAEGWPDIIAVLPPAGRTLLVEVKPPGEVLSSTQRRRIEELRAAGAVVVVVQGVQDMPGALKELEV